MPLIHADLLGVIAFWNKGAQRVESLLELDGLTDQRAGSQQGRRLWGVPAMGESEDCRSAFGGRAFSQGNGLSREVALDWHSSIGLMIAVILIAAAGLIFDAMTPQMVSVTIFYTALVLIGSWFSNPKSALVLALLATPLIIVGYWITAADNSPVWEAWMNRALATGVVWMTAVFVWHIRVLGQKLQAQIEIDHSLSHEIEHRIGNQLQLVASFLTLQAAAARTEEARRAVELAGSRLKVIGNIQRLLSHSKCSQMVSSSEFISALIEEIRSALPDRDQIGITIRADKAELTPTKAIVLGAVIVEFVNNAIKHAFPEGVEGMVTVRFTVSKDDCVVECEDDGIGINEVKATHGFGTQNIADLAHLMRGTITCQSARRSDTRPGTMWRLVIPA